MYGECARKLWYAINENKLAFTQQDIDTMNKGTQKHIEVENNIYPDTLHEHKVSRSIPTIFGIREIGSTIDCAEIKSKEDYELTHIPEITRIIEIKPKYTRMAYYQTLITRFILPDIPIFIYDYIRKREFPLKADYNMSIVYLGRIITAIHIKPPKVPYAQYSKAPCNKCLFRTRCWTEESEPTREIDPDNNKKQWLTWKMNTEKPINILKEACL